MENKILEVRNLKNIIRHQEECSMRWMISALPLKNRKPWES